MLCHQLLFIQRRLADSRRWRWLRRALRRFVTEKIISRWQCEPIADDCKGRAPLAMTRMARRYQHNHH